MALFFKDTIKSLFWELLFITPPLPKLTLAYYALRYSTCFIAALIMNIIVLVIYSFTDYIIIFVKIYDAYESMNQEKFTIIPIFKRHGFLF